MRLRRQIVSPDQLRFYQSSVNLHKSSQTSIQGKMDTLEKDAKDHTLNCALFNEHSVMEEHLNPECPLASTSMYVDEPDVEVLENDENCASSTISNSDRLNTNGADTSMDEPSLDVLVSLLDSNRLCSNVVSQMQEADNFSPAGSLPESTVNLETSFFKLFSDSMSPKQFGLTHYVTVNLSKSRVSGPEYSSTARNFHSEVRKHKRSYNQKSFTGIAHEPVLATNATKSQVMDAKSSLTEPAGIIVKRRTRKYTNKVFSLRSRPMFKDPKDIKKSDSHKRQTTHLDFNGHIKVTGIHRSSRLDRSCSATHKLLSVEMQSDPKLSLKPYVELSLNNNLKRKVSVLEEQMCPVPFTEGAANKNVFITPQSELLTNSSKKKNVTFSPFTPSKRLRLVVTNGSIDLDIASSASDESN